MVGTEQVQYGSAELIAPVVSPPRDNLPLNNAIDIYQPLPDRRAMRQRLGIDDETFVFGSIGSLIPRKANHHTLEALAQFSLKHPEAKWKMVLVGDHRPAPFSTSLQDASD